jgi:hypothetical protein
MSNDNKTYTFYLPLFVMLPRVRTQDKKMMLNMNIYRNLNFMVNNQMKQIFEPIKGNIFKAEKIKISYFVEKKMRRLFDTKNITTVVDKFFCDWLVKNECIPDDNFMHVCYGGEDGTMGCITDRVIATVEIIL